jgi:hypothetical protein
MDRNTCQASGENVAPHAVNTGPTLRSAASLHSARCSSAASRCSTAHHPDCGGATSAPTAIRERAKAPQKLAQNTSGTKASGMKPRTSRYTARGIRRALKQRAGNQARVAAIPAPTTLMPWRSGNRCVRTKGRSDHAKTAPPKMHHRRRNGSRIAVSAALVGPNHDHPSQATQGAALAATDSAVQYPVRRDGNVLDAYGTHPTLRP